MKIVLEMGKEVRMFESVTDLVKYKETHNIQDAKLYKVVELTHKDREHIDRRERESAWTKIRQDNPSMAID